jgi:hypothetical protein
VDYVLVAVSCVAPDDVTPGDITADDGGWTELAAVTTSVPNSLTTHHDATTTIALKAYGRSLASTDLGGPWTFSVTPSGGVTGASSPSLDGALLRFGGITAVAGSTSASQEWGDGDYNYNGPISDLVVPSAGGSAPSLTALASNFFWPPAGAESFPVGYPVVGGISVDRLSILIYDGATGDLTFTGGSNPAFPDQSWGCSEAIALNLSGTWTQCDSDYDQTISTPGPISVSLQTGALCPQDTEALYGWGTLMGAGSGEW